jgi:hypothetical protein
MKIRLLISFFVLSFFLSISSTFAITTTYEDELVVDYECINAKLLGARDAGMVALCSRLCPRKYLYESPDYIVRKLTYCIADKSNATLPYAEKPMSSDTEIEFSSKIKNVNLFGLEVDRAILLLVRRVMLLIFAAAGLIDVAMGIFATYKYSLSEGNQEKIQEAVKIFKSLLIGTVVIFAGVVLIQIASMLTGVTGTLLDFDFVPRTGKIVFLYNEDEGRKCFIEQIPDPQSPGAMFTCDEETLVWTKP